MPEQAASPLESESLTNMLRAYDTGVNLTYRRALAISNSASAELVHNGATPVLRSLLMCAVAACRAFEAAGTPRGHLYRQGAHEAVQQLSDYALKGVLPPHWQGAA